MTAKPNGNFSLPPGARSLADVPIDLQNPKPIPQNVAKPANAKLTIRNYVTEEESKNYLVSLLMELGTKRKKGPWREYLDFYRKNLSGDFEILKPDQKKYVEKLKKDLEEIHDEEALL